MHFVFFGIFVCIFWPIGGKCTMGAVYLGQAIACLCYPPVLPGGPRVGPYKGSQTTHVSVQVVWPEVEYPIRQQKFHAWNFFRLHQNESY